MPGHEACRLYPTESGWHLEGEAVFSQGKAPCHLRYHIICSVDWHTQTAVVDGWVGDRQISISIRADAAQHWWLNEVEIPEVSGCIDLDLNFSPSTNTIAIRRMSLALGERKETTAAWLRFPSFTLEPLSQWYTRLRQDLYRYESGGGSFVAELVIGRLGFVIDYPGLWKEESNPS